VQIFWTCTNNFKAMTIFFSKNIEFIRKKRGQTQTNLASDLGFTKQQWNNYEKGLSYPKFLDFIKICQYFEVSETDLIHSDLSKEAPKEKKTLVEHQTQEELLDVYRQLVPQLQEKITKLESS